MMNRFNLCILALCAVLALVLGYLMSRRFRSLTTPSPQVGREELFFLLAILLIGSLAIYGSFLLGRASFAYRDVGSDTAEAYIPFYANLIESIRNGSFGAWNFEYGLGAAATTYQSWLLDPFNFLLVPLGLAFGSAHLSLILTTVQIVKIVFSGVVFDFLLKRYCETPLGRIVGASLFSFGGYLILWGQHYWLGSVYAAFPVIVLQFERLMERWSAPRFCAVAMVSALSVGWSAYCGFMSLLGTAIYCLLRLIHFSEGKHAIRRVIKGTLKLLLPVICGILLSGIVLVPYANYLLGETSRIASESEASLLGTVRGYLLDFVPLRWIPMVLSRFLGSGLISSGADIPPELVPPTENFAYVNCYEFIVLGFGAVSFILLAQFFHWAIKECCSRDCTLVTIAALLVAMYCFNEFLPALFNVFVEPKYRSSFVLAVPVCIALAVGWEQRVQNGKTSRVALAAGALPSLVSIVWSVVNSLNARLLCAAYLLITIVFIIVLLVSSAHHDLHVASREYPVLCMILAGLAIAGSILDGFYVTQVRVTCTDSNFPSRTAEGAKDTLDALAWIRQTDEGLYRVEKDYVDCCSYNDAMVEGYWGVNSYNSTTDSDVIEFYRAFWPNAYNGDSAVQDFRADSNGYSLLSQVGVRYLLTKQPVADSRFTLINQVGSVYVYRNEGATPPLFTRETIMTEDDLELLPTDTARQVAIGKALVIPDDIAGQDSGWNTAELSSHLELGGADLIVGTVDSTAATVACLSVPFSSGWNVKIDGTEIETFRANLGFVGFEVPKGAHTIELSFTLPGLREGAALTIVGAALTAASCLVGIRLASHRGSHIAGWES